jgi:hypothetical protein
MLMAVAQMVVAAKRFALKTRVRSVLSAVLYTALLLAVAKGLSLQGVPFPKAFPVLVLSAAAGAFITGLVSLRGLRSVLVLRKDG